MILVDSITFDHSIWGQIAWREHHVLLEQRYYHLLTRYEGTARGRVFRAFSSSRAIPKVMPASIPSRQFVNGEKARRGLQQSTESTPPVLPDAQR